jgi:hypothetical protein
MGYNSRLGKVHKKWKKIVKGQTIEEVEKMLLDDERCYYPFFHTEIHSLGKYYNFTKGATPFYSFDIQEECGNEFFIMQKHELKELIYEYHNLIYQNYEKLSKGIYNAKQFFSSRAKEWCLPVLEPYYLDQEHTDGAIVSSCQYEYAIFNLVHIYRYFNWKKYYLIYSAW